MMDRGSAGPSADHRALDPPHAAEAGWAPGEGPWRPREVRPCPGGHWQQVRELRFCLFHVSLEVINEALHLLHGRLVPGEEADALADTFKSSSVAGFLLQDIK